MAEKIVRCSEIARSAFCPYSILSEVSETKELIAGERAHELQAGEIERAIYTKQRRSSYIAVLIIIFLAILALIWMIMKGLI